MVAEEEALIARVDDDRVPGQSTSVEIVEQAPDVVVDRLNGRQVVLHVALVLPACERLTGERHAVAAASGGHGVGFARQPIRRLRGRELRWRRKLEIAPCEIDGDALLVLVNRVGSRGVIIPECRRLGDPLCCEQSAVRAVGLPWAMRRLVVQHEEERLVARAILDELDAPIRDDVGGVPAGVGRLRRRGVEHRIHVDTLPRQDLPAIEAHGIAAEVPFPDHPRVIATLLEQSRDREAGAVEPVEHRHAIHMRVLTCQDRRPTGRADGVRREDVEQDRAFACEAVDVRRPVHARPIRADGVRSVIVAHDKDNVRRRRDANGRDADEWQE